MSWLLDRECLLKALRRLLHPRLFSQCLFGDMSGDRVYREITEMVTDTYTALKQFAASTRNQPISYTPVQRVFFSSQGGKTACITRN